MKNIQITERQLTDKLKNTFKLHIPMVISNDIDKKTATNLMLVQQQKIASQISLVLKNSGMSIFKSTSAVIANILKESVEDMNLDGATITEAGMPYPSPSDVSNVIKNVSKSDHETSGNLKPSIKEGALVQTDYTILTITSKNLFKRIISLITGGEPNYHIMVKVYAVYVDADGFNKTFTLGNMLKKVSSKIDRQADSKSIFEVIFGRKVSFVQVITNEMVEKSGLLKFIKGKSVGVSIAITNYIYEDLKYEGYDLQDPSNIGKIVGQYGIFDFFIINEDTEELMVLDHTSMQFSYMSLSSIKKLSKESIKIELP